jgi:putative hydrolase of the HAD superfamily
MPPGELAQVVSPIWRPGRTGHASLTDIERDTAWALCLTPADASQLWRDMWSWYLGTLNHQLVDYLASLRPAYATGILSNSFVGAREREEERYGFGANFDPIIYSHEEGMEKPDPAFYRVACERLGFAAQEIVFVDDTPGHVTAAEAVGMRGVVFTDTSTAIASIERCIEAG